MSVLKLVSLLFPFVRDMILGEASLKYALKTNKLRVLLLFFLMVCFAWTVYSVPRIVGMAADQVKLEHQYQALEKQNQNKAAKKAATAQEVSPVPDTQPVDTTGNTNNDSEQLASEGATPPPLDQTDSEFKARQRSWLDSLKDDQLRK